MFDLGSATGLDRPMTASLPTIADSLSTGICSDCEAMLVCCLANFECPGLLCMLSFENGLTACAGEALPAGDSKAAVGTGRPAKGLSLACWGLSVFPAAPTEGKELQT